MKKYILILLFILPFYSIAFGNSHDEIIPVIKEIDILKFNMLKEDIDDWCACDQLDNSLLTIAFRTLHDLDLKYRGKTALHFAVLNKDFDMVILLIEKGASSLIKDENGNTPYLLARKNGYSDIADYIFKKNIEKNNSIINSNKADPDNTNQVNIDKNNQNQYETDKERAPQNEQTPRELKQDSYPAQKNNIIMILNYIMDKCDNVNDQDSNGRTALHYAVLSSEYNLVDKLINKGADVNAVDRLDFSSPLILAAKMGEWHIVKLLIDKGANTDLFEKSTNEAEIAIIKEDFEKKDDSDKPEKENYIKPENYNFKFIVFSDSITDPENDERTYYQVYINKQEQGRTSIGLDSQKKEYTAMLPVNRHLLTVEKYMLDKKKAKYIKLNNIEQPKPGFFYFEIPDDKIVVIIMKQNLNDRITEFFLDYEKEKTQPGNMEN